MLTLSLLRHAKSSWDDPTQDDFDRPLAPRGKEAAPRVGAEMRRRGLVPDLVVSSPSARTRATLALVKPELDRAKVPVRFEDGLYLASPAGLLDIIHRLPDTARHVLILGHNPGLQNLAVKLTGRGDEKTRRAVAAKFPTAALAVLAFDVERWADVASGKGNLIHFLTPKRLAAEGT